MNSMLSVIIPAFNETSTIETAADRINSILNQANINHELLFVDDGSQDSTWEKISRLSLNSDNIHGIHFSRNFGKEAAIMAGLSYAKGDCCVVIDCDLQHPPEKIVEMYRLWEQGFEVIEAIKAHRGTESSFRSFSAHCFYKIISKATRIDMQHASDFKLLDRKAVLALINMPERNSFFRALSSWIGFKTTQIEFDVQDRTAGESKWSTRSLVRYAFTNISSFSAAPMQIITFLGVITLLISCVFGTVSLVQKIKGVALGGFTTVILLLLFIGSVIMISLGIMGYYIAKIYDEIKGRPKYIISETC